MVPKRLWAGVILGMLWAAPMAAPAAAQDATETGARNIGFWIDNDLFSGRDQDYTNGFQLYFLSGDRPDLGIVDWLADRVPWIEATTGRRYGFAFGQKMYTPEDITLTTVDPDDRPYAGWLYGRISLLAEAPRHVDRIDLDVGVVGPASLAGPTQRFVHRHVPGARTPRGWGNQLRNEPGVVLTYERLWRDEQPTSLGPLEVDISPHAAGSVGNVLTFVGAGFTVRFGDNLPAPVGALVTRPTVSIPYGEGRESDFSWYLYASTEARWVVRNIFLDGNTWRSSHSVSKTPIVGNVQLGVTARYGRFGVTYAHNFQTPEFEQQNGISSYGSVRLSYQF